MSTRRISVGVAGELPLKHRVPTFPGSVWNFEQRCRGSRLCIALGSRFIECTLSILLHGPSFAISFVMFLFYLSNGVRSFGNAWK